MKKLKIGRLLATASVLALAGAASAQAQGPAPVNDIFNQWYVGFNGGYRWADGDLDKAPLTFKPWEVLGDDIDLTKELPGFRDGLDVDGGVIGFHFGVNDRFGVDRRWVGGWDWSWMFGEDSQTSNFAAKLFGDRPDTSESGEREYFAADFNEDIDVELNMQTSLRFRLGRTYGDRQQLLLFISGGVGAMWYDIDANGQFHACELESQGGPCSGVVGDSDNVMLTGAFSKDGIMFGPALSFGFEYAFGDRQQWSLGGEALAEFYNGRGFLGFQFPDGYQTGKLDDIEVYKVRVRLTRAISFLGGGSQPVAMK